MLEIKKLSYAISGKQILKDVSFKIDRGEFVGLLGPNGAGKTTLLKILSGIYRDYTGAANLHLMPVKNLSPRGLAQTIAMVPQESHFAFSFSALEVVLMGRTPYKTRFSFDSEEDLQIARVAMDRTDCLQFANQDINTLSGGEKQRVLLARALAQKPQILLLDEPASHLDLKHQMELYHLLRDLNQQDGITIVCVVHDLNMASQYFSNLLFLKDGVLLLQGPARVLMTEKNLEQVFDVSCTQLKSSDGHSYFFPRGLQS